MTEPDVYDLAGRSGTVTNGTERAEQTSPDGDGGNGPYRGDTASPARSEQQDQGDVSPDRGMTLAELKTAAYNGKFPDGHLPMPDRIYFWALRDMYQRFKAGKINKVQGEEEQDRAIRQYRQDLTQYNSMVGIVKHIVSFWREIEAAASEYAKSPNRTAEADKFYNAVYGAMPK